MPKNATEIGQRRKYTFRGKAYPSVTTILKAWPAEWMIAYGAKHAALRALDNLPEVMQRRLVDGYEPTLKWIKAAAYERRDVAAGTGTDLHSYLEARAKGAEADPDAPMSGMEQAIEAFIDCYRPEFLFVESQVFSVTDGWAGSVDAFVRIYGKVGPLDLKTSPNAPTDHKARLQLAAYGHGDFIGEDDREVAPVPVCDTAWILAIPRDNPENWQLIETPAGAHEYARFLDCKRLWEFYDETKETGIGELVLPQMEMTA